MADFIDSIKQSLLKLGSVASNRNAVDWFRNKASELSGNIRLSSAEANRQSVLDFAKNRQQKQIKPGDMFMFVYDAKHKATLKYYDTFPLVFPISFGTDHFIGLNLHYLHPDDRARLFDALLSLANNTKFDSTTKLKLSWQMVSGFPGAEATVHKYLYSQVRSKFIKVDPKDWKWVVFMPFDNFVTKSAANKYSRTKVWKDSRKK